jgi:hypothetical protein
LLGVFFDPLDGSDIFLRNIVWLSTDYMTIHSKRCNSLRRKMISQFHYSKWFEM